MGICLEVWGDYALFTRPEMKAERVSYDMMPPSAARGLVESIFWHPGLSWIIDRIHVCKPLQFTNLRRNEVKATVSARTAKTVMERGSGSLYLATSEEIQQRAALLLQDVHYVIEAHFVLTDRAAPTDNPGKFPRHREAPHSQGAVLPCPLFRLPGIPRPLPVVPGASPCPRSCKGSGTWAGCSGTWTTVTPRKSARCSSGQCSKTVC